MAYLLHERKSFYTAVILNFVISWKSKSDSNRQNQETGYVSSLFL